MRYSYRNKKEVANIEDYLNLLNNNGFIYDDENPEIVFVFGGDGTVLKTIHQFEDKIDKITLVGVKAGTLGFYTDFEQKEFEELMNMIKLQKYEICKLPLLEYQIETSDKKTGGLSLNEVTILSPEKTIVVDIRIDNKYLETFRGTGLICATPSGSTAYSKSLGGAIVDIELPSMQLTEIASINNRIYKTIGSSLVFSKYHEICLVPKSKGYVITNDNNKINIEDISKMWIKVSNKYVNLLTHTNHSFFSRVKFAFLGESND